MAALGNLPPRHHREVANGLIGVVDRWDGGENHRIDAQRIYRIITNNYPVVRELVDRKWAQLRAGPGQEAAQNWIEAVKAVIGELEQHPSFGPLAWVFYLGGEGRMRRYDVVFIGGGPIGLWSAILAKVRMAALSILVMEKRTSYLRTHTLGIDQSAFDQYPQGINRRLDELVRRWREIGSARINSVENELLALAQQVGIQIEIINVSHPQSLSEAFPGVKVFVGADGARSVVSGTMFPTEQRLDITIHRLVQVQYQTRTPAGPRFRFNNLDAFKTIAAMNTTLIDERISRRGDQDEKTLTFAVQERVFQGMGRATFRDPFRLNTPALPVQIAEDVYLWMGMKETLYGEAPIPGSERIVGIDGRARVSSAFVKEYQGSVWCLVGDAAASFPLQRGFNVGLKCGTILAESIVDFCQQPDAASVQRVETNGAEGSVPLSFRPYANFGATTPDQELCFLNCPLDQKRKGIGAWKVLTALGSGFPAITKLDSVTVARYREIGRNPGDTPQAYAAALMQGPIAAIVEPQPEAAAGVEDNLSVADRIRAIYDAAPPG